MLRVTIGLLALLTLGVLSVVPSVVACGHDPVCVGGNPDTTSYEDGVWVNDKMVVGFVGPANCYAGDYCQYCLTVLGVHTVAITYDQSNDPGVSSCMS